MTEWLMVVGCLLSARHSDMSITSIVNHLRGESKWQS